LSDYQVLARTWRPETFDAVVGQEHVTRTLKNSLSSGRVAHAYCFSGARGVGKTTTARILAKALNCKEGPTPTPCNECENCREITSGSSPDVIEIDGATYTQVERVRELQENLQYIPAKSRCKLYIIDEVHMLSRSAFNALLKTLEEPPAHVRFVFATTEPHRIPETILSRCQRFDFRQLAPSEIAAQLQRVCEKEGFEVPAEGLGLIARAAEGSMRDALSLLDQLISLAGQKVEAGDVASILGRADQALLARVVEDIRTSAVDDLLRVVEELVSRGQDLRVFCRDLLEYLRHLLVCRTVDSPAGLIPYSEEVVADVEAQAREFSAESLHRLFEGLRQAEQAVKSSDSPQWVLEVALLRLASLEPVVPMEEVLAKIATLEEATRGSGSLASSGAARERTLFEMPGEPTRIDNPEAAAPPVRDAEQEEPEEGPLEAPAVREPPHTIKGFWERLLAAVEKRAFRVAQLLKEGQPVSLDQRELAVRFVSPFCATFFEENEHRTMVQAEAESLAGRPIRLKVVRASAEKESASSEPKRPKPRPTQAPKPGGALDHHDAMVEEAMESFGGKIIEENYLPSQEE
jgi:DNA polymerase-3 subunit gamma/tau